MRVLLDHCVPRALGRLLVGHEVSTAYRCGWAELRNGKLLIEAGFRFDVLLTVDQNLRHQQDDGELPIPVIVLVARTNRLEDLSPLIPSVLRLLGTKLDRRVYAIDA